LTVNGEKVTVPRGKWDLTPDAQSWAYQKLQNIAKEGLSAAENAESETRHNTSSAAAISPATDTSWQPERVFECSGKSSTENESGSATSYRKCCCKVQPWKSLQC